MARWIFSCPSRMPSICQPAYKWLLSRHPENGQCANYRQAIFQDFTADQSSTIRRKSIIEANTRTFIEFHLNLYNLSPWGIVSGFFIIICNENSVFAESLAIITSRCETTCVLWKRVRFRHFAEKSITINFEDGALGRPWSWKKGRTGRHINKLRMNRRPLWNLLVSKDDLSYGPKGQSGR